MRVAARSLANMLIAFRTGALFYPTRDTRLAWVEQILADVRFDRIVRGHSTLPQHARSAVVEFCLGHIGVNSFGRRLKKAFRRVSLPDLSSIVGKRPRFDVAASEQGGTGRLDPFWTVLYGSIRVLTVTPDRSDTDSYDARIEFARRFTLDLNHGMPGVFKSPNESTGEKESHYVARDECVATLVSVGHLNKPMAAPADLDTIDIRSTEYPVYVFGSNYVWIHSDAVYTFSQAVRYPQAFENDSQVVTFTKHLLALERASFVPDTLASRDKAVETNRPAITSLSRNDVSLQFSFAMPDARFYVANVFYLKGGDPCCTDFRYKRKYLSNSCHCENRLAHWRVCVSLAALDGSKFEVLIGNSLSDFVISVVRAFYRTKENQGAHYFVNQFTGLALVSYMNDSTALGGMKVDTNQGADESSRAVTCDVHSWLRGHTNVKYWRTAPSMDSIETLLLYVPQLIVVYRPLLSESVGAANGPNVFLNYKTFEDVFIKYVLLTLKTLTTGFGDKRKTVAYKNRDSYLLFYPDVGDPQTPNTSGGQSQEDRLQSYDGATEVTDPNRATFSNVQRDVNDLFQRVFSAPSRLYVHANVLATIGFNVTAVNSGTPSRTFMHTEPGTEDNCVTVVSSSPLVVLDETNNSRPLKTEQTVQSLRVMKRAYRPGDRMLPGSGNGEDPSKRREFRETAVSLEDFWPGVYAILVSFTDTVLSDVHFAFFTAEDGNDSLDRLTGDGLTRLSRHNLNGSFQLLPPPVIYTLQQMYVRFERS